MKKFYRKRTIHFFINISIGIIIAIVFHFLEHTDWGEDTINKAFDVIIAKEAEESAEAMESVTSERDTRISNRIALVEINHEAYKKWGKPLLTPRDKLAEIVEAVCKAKAGIVVLDILLEDRDCCHPEGDKALRKVLEDITASKSTTKIIFPVRIGYDGEVRTHLFKDLLGKNPNFYPATANVSAAATDRVIRYWVPFDTYKDGVSGNVLWNMSFLTAMLAEGKEAELKELEHTLTTGNPHGSRHVKLDHGREIIITSDRDDIYRNRIRFLLIPKGTLPYHPGGNLFDRAYQAEEVKHAPLKDKIVIIGNSSPDAGDIHRTPVGTMAGMFIIGNAANTISLGMQPSHSPMWLNIVVEAAVIAMAAILFLYLHSFLAQVLSSVILLITLGVASYYYFLHTGAFLNFIFAVVGMSFHRTIANIEELIQSKGGPRNEHS